MTNEYDCNISEKVFLRQVFCITQKPIPVFERVSEIKLLIYSIKYLYGIKHEFLKQNNSELINLIFHKSIDDLWKIIVNIIKENRLIVEKITIIEILIDRIDALDKLNNTSNVNNLMC